MLVDFISDNRDQLIALTRAKVAHRSAPRPTADELATGVPLFLDQLVETLKRPPFPPADTIGRSAATHGAALLGLGYTVEQVVHDYGDICQAVTELAAEIEAPITVDEFHTLNLCLDNAIAGAVTEHVRVRERTMADDETERLGVFAHELRNRIGAAQLAFLTIKSGRAPISGSVAAVVARSLRGMTELVNRALMEVRLESGSMRRQRTPLHQLIDEAVVDGTMEAGVHGVSLSALPTDHDIEVDVDPQILAGSIANLLQNAIKFTHSGGNVTLRTSLVANRIAIEIEDECGGLPAGKAGQFFMAFERSGTDRTGLGLGLYISRKGIQASGGTIHVRDIPGKGCAFTINLPVFVAAL